LRAAGSSQGASWRYPLLAAHTVAGRLWKKGCLATPELVEAGELVIFDRTVRVTCCGRVCIGRRKINLSTVFACQWVGIREIEEKSGLSAF